MRFGLEGVHYCVPSEPSSICTGPRRLACCAACCHAPRVRRPRSTIWPRRCCAPQACHPPGRCRTRDRLQGRPRRGGPCCGGCCRLGACRAQNLGAFATLSCQCWRRWCPSGRRRARRQLRWRRRRRSRRKAHCSGEAPTLSRRCDLSAASLTGYMQRIRHWVLELLTVAQAMLIMQRCHATASVCSATVLSLLAVLTCTGLPGPTPLPMKLTAVLKLRLHAR